MKYLSILLVSLFLVACSQQAEWPTELKGKQALLSSQKDTLKRINSQVLRLEKEIADLLPNKVEKTFLVVANPLTKTDFKSYVKIQGSVTTDNKVMASSETGGRIISMTASEGQYVQSGQQIATMDVVTFEKQLEELQTAYDLAVDVFERQERLWSQNIGSELQFLEAKSGKDRLEKSMETLKSQLAKKDVFAPISGYIDMVFLKQGEMAGPGTPIVQILNTGSVKVVADVPENYLSSIKRGENVEIYFPAIDKTINRKVSMVGRSIDPSNRTFKIEMNTSNPGGTLKPNLLAELNIVEKFIKDQIVIPLEVILQEVTGKRFVFVVDESNSKEIRAKKVYITEGDSYDNEIVITEGLTGAEKLITNGISELQQGSLIIIE